MALLLGTDENRQYIQPLEMTVNDDEAPPPIIVDGGGSICCSAGCTLDDVAIAFRKGVVLSKHKYRFTKVYRETFTGKEAVDFLVDSGYASSRDEAVILGRQLAEKKKLFEHVHRNHEFKDANLFYHYIIQDDSKYTFTTHEPKGKGLFQMLRFVDQDRNFAEDQLEMPYSSGVDHPRFTVKESLVIRSKSSRTMMEKLMADDEDDDNESDAVELDMEGLDLGNLDQRRLDKYDSYFDLGREPSSQSIMPPGDDDKEVENDTIVTVKVLNKPPLQDIDNKVKGADRPISDVLAEARDKVHGVLLHCFNDRTYVIRDNGKGSKLEGATQSSTNEAFKPESARKRWISKSEESLTSIPEDGRTANNTSSRRTVFQRSNGGSNANSPRRATARAGKSVAETTKEENDKLLKTGAYSNSNRWVAKLGVIVQ